MEKSPCVYILASKRYGTLYTGVTSNLVKRVWEHKHSLVPGFTKKYGVNNLVFFEMHASMEDAILREKRIKEWKRGWKIELIEKINPKWDDLYDEICRQPVMDSGFRRNDKAKSLVCDGYSYSLAWLSPINMESNRIAP